MDFVNISFTTVGRLHIQDLLDRVEAEHAHKLAEQIRDSVGRNDYPGETEYAKAFVAGYRSAANEIDPEVKN